MNKIVDAVTKAVKDTVNVDSIKRMAVTAALGKLEKLLLAKFGEDQAITVPEIMSYARRKADELID